MRFGIVGGGFGLYGWLPAAAIVPNAVLATLVCYEPRLRVRPELAHLAERVRFVEDLDALLKESDCLIVARRPIDQPEMVTHLIQRSWRGCLVLEKPLAPNPSRTQALLATLAAANLRIGTGFIMERTPWGQALEASLADDRPTRVDISWTFLAHHYRHSTDGWKRRPAEGGGALRFFAIHLIAFLARCGDWQVVECSGAAGDEDDPAVTFSITNGTTDVHVRCDSCWGKEPAFTLTLERGRRQLWKRALSDPFADRASDSDGWPIGVDRRVPYLTAALRDLAAGGGSAPALLSPHVSLWSRIEDARAHV